MHTGISQVHNYAQAVSSPVNRKKSVTDQQGYDKDAHNQCLIQYNLPCSKNTVPSRESNTESIISADNNDNMHTSSLSATANNSPIIPAHDNVISIILELLNQSENDEELKERLINILTSQKHSSSFLGFRT